MDGDSSGRDEMAVPERMLVQVAVTGPRQISINVLPVREAIREGDGRLYARETPRHPGFPTTLLEYGLAFQGDQLICFASFFRSISTPIRSSRWKATKRGDGKTLCV